MPLPRAKSHQRFNTVSAQLAANLSRSTPRVPQLQVPKSTSQPPVPSERRDYSARSVCQQDRCGLGRRPPLGGIAMEHGDGGLRKTAPSVLQQTPVRVLPSGPVKARQGGVVAQPLGRGNAVKTAKKASQASQACQEEPFGGDDEPTPVYYHEARAPNRAASTRAPPAVPLVRELPQGPSQASAPRLPDGGQVTHPRPPLPPQRDPSYSGRAPPQARGMLTRCKSLVMLTKPQPPHQFQHPQQQQQQQQQQQFSAAVPAGFSPAPPPPARAYSADNQPRPPPHPPRLYASAGDLQPQ
jgi:hypothetical protein